MKFAPVSLVVPFLNEQASLPNFLTSIRSFTLFPSEIIFVDAGSTDKSIALIERFANEEKNLKVSVLNVEGAFPGGGRNAGVKAATQEWIAFLDVGIQAAPDWLENIFSYITQNKLNFSFGRCHVSAHGPVAKAVCALSYGYGARLPTLPGAMFKCTVFTEVGFFPEHLRAAEDLVWIDKLLKKYSVKHVCEAALIYYDTFPGSFSKIFSKWKRYSRFDILSRLKTKRKMAFAYFGFYSLLFLTLLFFPKIGGVLFALYLFMRVFVLSWKKSPNKSFLKELSVLFFLPFVALIIDFGKLVGFADGFISASIHEGEAL